MPSDQQSPTIAARHTLFSSKVNLSEWMSTSSPTTHRLTATPSRVFRPWEALSPIKPCPSTQEEQLLSSRKLQSSCPRTPPVNASSSPSACQSSTEICSVDPGRTLAIRHPAFLREVTRVQSYAPYDAWLESLITSYMSETANLESLRYQGLVHHAANTNFHATVHKYYDDERLILLTQATMSLECYKASMGIHVNPTPVPAAQIRMTVQPLTPASRTLGSSACSTPSSNDSAYISDSSRTSSPDVSSCCSPPVAPAGRPKNRLLNRQAVDLMEEWYSQHIDHPYPDPVTLDELATTGGIAVSQVRKWMANKRTRSFNTLTSNGSVHPKSLRKLKSQQRVLAQRLQQLSGASSPL